MRLNNAGAGIFVTINQTDLKGRTNKNIVRVRCLFVDLDHAPLEPATKFLPPTAVVESSTGRWHVYWRVTDCPLDKFEALQKKLAAKFGGDPRVFDLARVMRLPGFDHLKVQS
jgi:hypothetical protein